MIVLSIVSCLLFFITYFSGIAAEKYLRFLFAANLMTNFFETFLLGLVACYIYFNLLSFFVAVNYITLLPLLLPGIIILSGKSNRQLFFSRLSTTAGIFFSAQNLSFSFFSLLLFFLYWTIPPQVWDSGSYHYITIRWYEQFKIIPGLANVHGRFAFNPANFIISAAYSFTDITGQSLYPLNGVLTLVFYIWLYKKILMQAGSVYACLIALLAVLLFRIVLVNISSPSADLLSGILLFYCGFRTYELVKADKNSIEDYLPVIIAVSFAITAKLTAIPALLLLPFIYFNLIKKGNSAVVTMKCLCLAGLIVLPWLIRNFILSGYFLFPVPGTNFFHPDWEVPPDVVKLEYIFAKYGPRTVTIDYITLQKMNIVQLTLTWYKYIAAHYPSQIFIFLLSTFSPFIWTFKLLSKLKINRKLFLLWFIYYLGTWIWLVNSPEFRFGLPYLLLAIILPVLDLLEDPGPKWRLPPALFSLFLCIIFVHYTLIVLRNKNANHYSLAGHWFKPPRDSRYFYNNDATTFPYVNLGHGVKLYFRDKTHDCLNANGPCMLYRYGEIALRGNKIEDGFRNLKDEVKKYYPYIDRDK